MTTTTEAARHAWKIARNAQKPGGKMVESGWSEKWVFAHQGGGIPTCDARDKTCQVTLLHFDCESRLCCP